MPTTWDLSGIKVFVTGVVGHRLAAQENRGATFNRFTALDPRKADLGAGAGFVTSPATAAPEVMGSTSQPSVLWIAMGIAGG